MGFPFLRRPAAAGLAAYIGLLCALHARGFFSPSIFADWYRMTRSPCVRLQGRIISGFSEKRLGERIFLRADQGDACDGEGSAAGSVEVMAYLPRREEPGAEPCPGCRLTLEGRLRRPWWPRNPGDFDEKAFLDDRGAAFVFQAQSAEIDSGVPMLWGPVCWAQKAHRSLHEMLLRNFPRDSAAMLEGIVLGYKGPMDRGLHRAVQDAGVMHLLVPSGAKVVFVMGFFYWLCVRLAASARARWLVLFFSGGFYVLMAGAEPPYLRAFLSFLIGDAAQSAGRDLAGFQTLVLSAWIILILWPRALFSAGFQMTFAAAAGLMIAMPRWQTPSGWPKWGRAILRILMVSVVVQIMLYPILARMFGRVSLIGVLANMILVPASGLMMAGGFFLWALSLIHAPAAFDFAVCGMNAVVGAFGFICRIFASLPLAAVDVPPFSGAAAGAYYFFSLGILVLPGRRAALRCWILAAALALGLKVHSLRTAPDARLVVLSRGAAVLSQADGDYLFDSGAPPAMVRQALRALGVRHAKPVEPGTPPRVVASGLFGVTMVDPAGTVELFSRDASGEWKSEFCILASPSRDPAPEIPENCGVDRSISSRRGGAVWVTFKNGRYEIKTQREIHQIGRPVL